MLAARIGLRARAARLYRRLTDAPEALPALRAQGARILAMFWKGRSLTQTPSTFERMGEQVIALHIANRPAHELRLVAVELDAVVDDLTIQGPVAEADVLRAVATADLLESKANEAQTLLVCRADRQLTEGDLERFIETNDAEIAADREAGRAARRLLVQFRASRQGLRVVRGGHA
jgi:hypothetical protein